MRLKELELHGFKSFPDKTVLSFDYSFTAIVGPNGSGKSNLSDAIRWVLGEQSARQLRGGRMEDVIFGGTRARPKQGYAQVSLRLDGCAGLLPEGEDEITVTRRYYRSGESEYYLNRRQVRLRDVNELFMDTGLGQEGYALIGQGKIDEILSAKSTQRREIFEEAAGISHCRHQKEETQRKLERTQENLLRISDKLEELELQREPLRLQAEKAAEYLALREELRVLEISLWMEQLEEQRAKSDKLRSDNEALQRQLEQCTQAVDEAYAKSEALLLALRDQEALGEKLREQTRQAETDLQAGRQRAALLQDRIRRNEESCRRVQGEQMEKAAQQAGVEADITRQTARQTELQRQAETCREELTQAQERLGEIHARQESSRQAREEAIGRAREEAELRRTLEKQLEEAWMQARMAEHELAAKIKLLSEMAQVYEGYTKGVKTAMGAVRKGWLTGVLGPVGELFHVGARYTVALETALGGAMQNLLVENEEAGKAVLRYVKERDGGRVTCLPLTALRPSVLEEKGIEQEPGFVAIAPDLVSCDAVCRPAVQALLGRTVVVEDLDHGVQLAKKRAYRFSVVTLDGEILRPGGSMTGGSVNRRGGILSRGAEEEALNARLSQAREDLARREQAADQARESTQRALDKLERLQKEGLTSELEEEAVQWETQVSSLRETLVSLQAEIRSCAPLLEQLRGQLAAAQREKARQEELLENYGRENRELAREILQIEAKETELAENRERLETQLRQCGGQRLQLEAERTQADRQAREQNDLQLRLQREVAALEQKRLQASMEESRLLDKLWDTYGMTHEGAQSVRIPVERGKALRRAGQLNEAIRALGQVNLGAVEEFQRVEERYQYLNAQKTDVENAQRELEGIIAGITQEMEDIFLREFSKIQTAFSKTFTDLFGGGQGALVLEDEENVLTCGVDIRVQPPGKTLRTISLLSGGERALVAIALYFAIIQIHPTPFCVLDEIEAALDEANGARFIRYLRAMEQETQFIFITHRRETMEAADLLYGVTMESQGVSKVLKLDLKQAEELLNT